ncbi:MAG: hypothetical protein JNN06_09265, partial [Gemmobacter sp.]|uniref:hypothetical protein n=1 Tax=Gemmobacter sp. TaxID=1898957 RepID=UPI001A59FAF2
DAEAESAGPDENWRFWQEQINTALVVERRWRREALHAENLYFGPDEDSGGGDSASAPLENRITDETGLIHSNIEVLKPLVFSETPTPIVQRRWRGDGKSDATDLMAAEAGQRIASWILQESDFDAAMERSRDDWLIAGRGSARVLYRAEFGEQVEPDPLTGEQVVTETKTHEEVLARGNEWRRVVIAPAAGWDQVPWIAFEIPMTRSRIEKRFPEHKARFAYGTAGLKGRARAFGDEDREDRTLVGSLDRSGEPVVNPFDTATVWEIWNRETRTVVWWSPDCRGAVLDKQDDPLGLEKFFPMAKPLMATTRGDSLNPRPDISYYAERAKEIDTATRKMKELLGVLAVAGLFPGADSETVKALMSGKNQLIPVQSWISLMSKGGTSSLIQWLPLDAIITCLTALQNMREAAKQAMFEASGVSDIMRAQGDPNETATAQQIKGRYAGLRLSSKQRRMAVFARDTLRIMVEIALELFDGARLAQICALDIPETEAERAAIAAAAEQAMAAHAAAMQQYQLLQQAAQVMQQNGQQVPPLPPPPEPPKLDPVPETSFEAVHERLRRDFSRKITVQIETDSTVLADEQADKEARIEFLGAFATFVQQLAPLAATGQFDMKTVKEILLFGVRAFPKSRTLEGLIAQMPDEPKGEQREETQVTVAKIRAETDKLLKEMDMA